MPKATYTPIENGDPISTSVAGVEFAAGQPVEIGKVMVSQLTRETYHDKDGVERGRGVERQVPLIEILRGNPYFRIEGDNGALEGQIIPPSKKAGRPKLPTTPEEYRAHAIAWFAKTETAKELGERWRSEAALRSKIGIADDGEDISYLRPYYEGRYHELEKAE